MYVGWRLPDQKFDCQRISDTSTCFCGHLLGEHSQYSGKELLLPPSPPSLNPSPPHLLTPPSLSHLPNYLLTTSVHIPYSPSPCLQVGVSEFHAPNQVAGVKHTNGFRPDQRMWVSSGTSADGTLTRARGEQSVDVNILTNSINALE